jgi:NAD(P)-dependent dehydrogenase (short-subunit alcohol dehydrogenase family)
MAEPRSVVVTGASRGLGLATAAHLHRVGWKVVAAMRSPEEGLERLRAATGSAPRDPRLIGVRLDLDDPESIGCAATMIRDAVGTPDGLVHNAGVAGVGCLEELPMSVWQQVFSTNFFGPVRLTKELLPCMRAAGRGRIVMISSEGAIRGMPAIGAYSAAKGALERWAESLSLEVAAFGLGITVLVAGTFDTDMLTLTRTYADPNGPYAAHHEGLESAGRRFLRFAGSPDQFAPAVAKALDDRGPFVRRGVGLDARLLLLANRLLPTSTLQRILGRAVGTPRPGSVRVDERNTIA